MLYSQGIPPRGARRAAATAGSNVGVRSARGIWRLFARALLPVSRDAVPPVARPRVPQVFGIDERLDRGERRTATSTASTPARARTRFRPRALVRALQHRVARDHRVAARRLAAHHRHPPVGWDGRVVTTYRPDAVIDPNIRRLRGRRGELCELTGEDAIPGAAISPRTRAPRRFPSLRRDRHRSRASHRADRDLAPDAIERLLDQTLAGTIDRGRGRAFRAQMLTEMAAMSRRRRDGHADSSGRLPQPQSGLSPAFGRDKGADIPMRDRLCRIS